MDGIIECRTVVTYKASKMAQNLSFAFKTQADPTVTKQLTRRLYNAPYLRSLRGERKKKGHARSKKRKARDPSDR